MYIQTPKTGTSRLYPKFHSTSFNENIILFGDFNIDVLHYKNDNQTDPEIILPTRLTLRSKTLIDNFFADETSISDNLSYSISDHFPQLITYPEFKAKNHRKETIYK